MKIKRSARLHDLTRQFVTQGPLHIPGCFQQPIQVYAGLHSHLHEHVHGVFGANVSSGPRSKGAASDPAERAFKVADASR